MSDEFFDKAFLIIIGFVFFIGAVFLTYNMMQFPLLKDCAKQHNVYECELVAVPKRK